MPEKITDRLPDRNLVYTNRELSWLQFNTRVLEESEDPNVPLYERLRFLAIFQSNLDEFFMVRVGSLYDQSLLKEELRDSRTKMTSIEQLTAIYRETSTLLTRKMQSYHNVKALLGEQQIEQVTFDDLGAEDLSYLEQYFEHEIRPLASPQIVDKRYPFPFLKNKEIYVGLQLQTKSTTLRFGIIPASGHFARTIFLPGGNCRFVLVEDLILHFADRIFDRYTVLDKALFRLTRNADIDLEEQMHDVDVNFRDAMEVLLKKRRKLAPVRLELSSAISTELFDYFCHQFTLIPGQVFIDQCPLDFSYVFMIEDKVARHASADLFYPPLTSQISDQIDPNQSMMAQIFEKDLLFHYPYNAINPFLKLLREAAFDPNVVSIKITLYRVARNSRVINALIAAAENGKEVHVVVELRARFDEENNIDWSKRLEEAGCTVMYGLPGYKVHSKLLLITRKENDQIQYLTQIGTGNYNEKTSTLYTDLSLMTANPQIGVDASIIFNALFMGATTSDVDHLLVAPLVFKPAIITLIDKEIAFAQERKPARIVLKMNSLSDKILIDKLIEASCAGVKVTMLIRGICCVKPQVVGFTENMEIYSLVGRFLEHSRIFIFGAEARQQVYISSADFMTRNTVRRVEVATPIYDKTLQDKIVNMMNLMLADNQKLRVQQANGKYHHCVQEEGTATINAQEALYAKAYAEAEAALQVTEPAVTEAAQTTTVDVIVTKPAPKKGLVGFFKRLFRK